MLQLLELVPIVLFFIAFKMDGETVELLGFSHQFDGIFSATAVLMLATALQVAITWLVKREIEKKLLWLLAAVIVFGTATLVLRNELFIQWKPTIFNWGMAIVFLAALLFSEKSLIERMLGAQMQLPKTAWLRLNQLWIANFTIVGALNIYVAYNFTQEQWVDYKLYSAIGFTVALMVLTVVLIFPYLKDQVDPENETNET